MASRVDVGALEAESARLEREMHRRSTEDEAAQRLLKIPGVGPIMATALAATIPDANAFRSAREFAAWLGLVPRQSSSGSRERRGGITKMGHAYLRRLLVLGAQAVLGQAAADGHATPWLSRLLREKPRKVAAVALANKTACASSGLSWPEAKRTGSPHEPPRPAVSAGQG